MLRGGPGTLVNLSPKVWLGPPILGVEVRLGDVVRALTKLHLDHSTTARSTMGRTVIPYTQIVDQERSRWQKFRRALRKEDQGHFDQLFELARLHTQAGVYASQPWPMEVILMSMLLEHQKALAALAERVRRLEGEGDDDPGLAL